MMDTGARLQVMRASAGKRKSLENIFIVTQRKSAVILGAQWGDEGKGKIVDVLSEQFDVVARYAGGHNAGHTVIIGGKKFVLQLIPCGVLRPGCKGVIGNGVVLDPMAFLNEVKKLKDAGLPTSTASSSSPTAPRSSCPTTA